MPKPKTQKERLDRWVEPIAKGVLLGGLDRSAILELLELADLVVFEAGDILMRQGEEGDSAYLILEGSVDVVIETPLGEVVVATLGEQQIVGETGVFSNLPRTATVRAREQSTALRLDRAHVGQVVARHPQAATGLLAALGRRVAALNRPLTMLTLAAEALAQTDIDTEALANLFDPLEDFGPFAQSFHNLIVEMEGKQTRRQEMLVAGRLQQSILPQALDFASHNAPFAVEALMRPSREIGGDFYDFFFTEDGRKAVLVVADVSGKGIPAALFMAVSRTLLRATVTTSPSIEIALARANAQLEAENPECLFVTVFLAELDLATGAFSYVNAGHCDGYLVRPGAEPTLLPASGPAVALLPRPAFQRHQVQLRPGDLLLLVSDGVTEAFAADGAVFGEDRLLALAGDLAGRDAAQALAAVDRAVTDFAVGCEQSDDITCLALAYLPGR